MDDVAVIGAGPYGLSIAAHLANSTLKLRVFGTPMNTWRRQMPAGMHLKSEGCASTLYDPAGRFPMREFCRERGIPYADFGLPVSRRNFADYGMEFAKRHVPMLEDRNVVALRRTNAGFELEMADGETITAKRVISAVGITHYAWMPDMLTHPGLVSHSSAHHDLSRFENQSVAVIGGGASATDCAGLLAEAGATTHLFTRRDRIEFHEKPRYWRWRDRLKAPRTTIGPGWRSVMYTNGPILFHKLPAATRIGVTRQYLGPAACWFMREPIEEGVTQHTSVQVTGVAAGDDGRAELSFEGAETGSIAVDHVIAATGYRVDLNQLPFLNDDVRNQIQIDEAGSPVLSTWFESSIPGLHFVGPSAANAFGPLLRFACGARFAARRLSRRMN